MALVQHVVVDSGAFIKNASIKDIGQNIYTIADVVSEIKDKATRDRLQVLPYELKFREPDPGCIKTVTDFTKKTGDFPSLSATDIRLIALTYQLEKEYVGTDHLKLVPDRSKVEFTTKKGAFEKATDIAGFYVDGSEATETADAVDSVEGSAEKPSKVELQDENQPGVARLADGDTVASDDIEEGEGSDNGESSESEEEDGWITPKNLQKANERMAGGAVTERAKCVVGCLTLDFAMQNVLIQMGLNVISVDGMVIKSARSYVLRCFSCFKISTEMWRTFCHHCGNQTVRKISVSVNEDGTLKYYLSNRPPRKPRQRFNMNAIPKGGKYAFTPRTVEDQRMPQQRAAKDHEQRYGVFSPDYESHSSPFAQRDTTSRSAVLGLGRNFNKRQQPDGRRRRK